MKPTVTKKAVPVFEGKVQISTVIPASDKEKLEILAKKELSSQGQIVRKIIHSHLSTIESDMGGR